VNQGGTIAHPELHSVTGRVTIDRARASDAQRLSELALRSKAHWPYSAAQLALWRDGLTVSEDSVSQSPTFVALIDAQLAGFYQLVREGTRWRLDHLWLLPEHVGHGLGRRLLRHACALVASEGGTSIEIDSDPFAEPFYRACKAARVGSVAAPIEGDPCRVRPQLRLSIAASDPATI
jgi:GNAT superfamily N-acetyltransferase